jgi:hypothetical protein
MKRFSGWIMLAGLLGTATAADAQMLAPYSIGRSPYTSASDFADPYSALPPEPPGPRYGPMLLSPPEIYEIVRESGFSPLGIPQQRGFVYTISVIDRGGEDGRLVIDARTGRIIRFTPAYRMGDNFNEDLTVTYGPVGPLPPVSAVRGPPRPPAAIPRVASRTHAVPVPKPSPLAAGEPKPQVAKPAAPAAQQSAAAAPTKPAEQQTTGQTAAPPVVEARPAPQIAPTQEMPKAQGLE